LAISAISIHLSVAAVGGDRIVISTELVPMKLRVANALVSYIKYIGKMIWPQDLAVYYPFPRMVPIWQTIGTFMLLACISVIVMRALKKAPYLAVGWLWYLGTLVPVLGLLQAGLWPAMADRWAYVPLIGIFMMIVWGLSDLAARWRLRKAWTSLTIAAVLSIFTITTWVQVGYWNDSIPLFEHTLDVTDNNDVAHNNLGLAWVSKGKIDHAFPHFLEALKINPTHAKAHLNAGTCYMFQGKLDKAIEYFSIALRIAPDYALAHHNLGNTFARQGKTSEAIRHYLETIRLDPANARARNELNRLYQDKGESVETKYK
jgi:tetratricopeptide (TPR) repeat protein